MLEIIAFCCGALVMVLEMVGARVLAPHVGTSAVVWTSLIGVVLACLAVGAWLGGRLADRHLSRRGLAFILTGASLGSALAAGTHRLVGEALSVAITDIHHIDCLVGAGAHCELVHSLVPHHKRRFHAFMHGSVSILDGIVEGYNICVAQRGIDWKVI